VDGLEQEYGSRLLVIRVDVQETAGRKLAAAYGFQFTPTFIFFDAEGRELWRQVGGLDLVRLRSALE
jgi:thioredoxin-related protein